MRVNVARVEGFQFDCGEKSLQALQRGPGTGCRRPIVDSVVVQGALRVTFQGTASEPLMKCRAGPRIAIIGGAITGLVEAELQTNDVLWVSVVQGLLPRGVDDIIGWCDDPGNVSNHRRVVCSSVKRNDFRHVDSCAQLAGSRR